MGFTIDYGFGGFGLLLIIIIACAAVIVAIFLFSAANVARREVVDEEHDEGHDAPIA